MDSILDKIRNSSFLNKNSFFSLGLLAEEKTLKKGEFLSVEITAISKSRLKVPRNVLVFVKKGKLVKVGSDVDNASGLDSEGEPFYDKEVQEDTLLLGEEVGTHLYRADSDTTLFYVSVLEGFFILLVTKIKLKKGEVRRKMPLRNYYSFTHDFIINDSEKSKKNLYKWTNGRFRGTLVGEGSVIGFNVILKRR